MGVSVGELTGSGTELAFDYPQGQKATLSELTWDLKDVAVAGVQASARLGQRIRVNFGYWWAIDRGNGMMVDRDWLFAPTGSVLTPTTDENWTDESRHPDTTVDSGTMVDANVAAVVLQSGPFSLHGILGVKNESWHWSARGGTYVYSYYDFRDSVGSFDSDQEVINYEQRFTIPYGGVGASWRKRTFAVETHLLLSPFVHATGSDYHALRDMTFEGDFFGGTFVGVGMNARWAFARRWSVALAVDYESVPEITGDVTITAPFFEEVYGVGGGIAMHNTMATLGLGYRF